MDEAVPTYRSVFAVHSAHSDKEEGCDERSHHNDQQQHYQAAHETRQAHADRLWIGGRSVLYDHGGVIARVRSAQRKVDVARCDNLDDPRSVHVRHLLCCSFVYMGGE